MWGWPEIVFLILTKIFSKSAKSFQEDWNMCMKWFTNRFSILESHSCHRHHSHTHHHYHICYHIHIKNVSEIRQSSIESKCCSTIPVPKQAEYQWTALEARRGKLHDSFSISTTFPFHKWYIIRHPSKVCYFCTLCLLFCAAAGCVRSCSGCVLCLSAASHSCMKAQCKCPWW